MEFFPKESEPPPPPPPFIFGIYETNKADWIFGHQKG